MSTDLSAHRDDYEWRSYSVPLPSAPPHWWTVKQLRALDDMDEMVGIIDLYGDGITDRLPERPYARTRDHFAACDICQSDEAERLTKLHRESVLMRIIES